MSEESMAGSQQEVPVVAIGASAGGVEALGEVISRIETGTGACYVVIQHLAPGHPSILHEILADRAAIPVAQIEDGAPIRAETIMVIPPGQEAGIHRDRFTLKSRDAAEPVFRPIDAFFASLAEEKGRDAYCVVLSGTGSDGTQGLREIKARGGVAIAQERTGARFPGMPDSAVATGLVDLVLPSADIGPRLRSILFHRQRMRGTDRGDLQREIEAALSDISQALSDATGHDFSDYKAGTLMRRIERRMSLMRLGSTDAFLKILRDQPDQASILANDFLIGVTRFFRDPEVFEQLRTSAIIPILDRKGARVRIWVPGCSTGEEVYSIAILFIEEMRARRDSRPLQIFGTDIDEHALLAARYGEFGSSAVEDLGRDRLETFFQPSGGSWRARPELREACVFAPHNLLQDPPFSRLDLISCRNMLIYLKAEVQADIFPRFHFALKPSGMLLLGPAESLAGKETLFHIVDKKARIFRRNDDADAGYSALVDYPRIRAHGAGTRALSHTERRTGEAIGAPLAEISRETAAQRAFLDIHAPPFAVVSSAGEVLYVSRRMAQFLSPSHGVPSSNLDTFLAEPLRVPARIVLGQAVSERTEASAENILVSGSEGTVVFDVLVSPVPGDADAYLLTLKEVRTIGSDSLEDAVQDRDESDRRHIERENVRLRRQAEAILTEYATSGQELKSSNEELMSMNEELQSSNEELETSREELQSINEELETVNAELRENNQQLMRANSDLKNLFEATDIAVLFLDRSFAVRSFTPSTTAIFGIKTRDIGRPIFDLASRIDYPDLRADAARVDATLQPAEREVALAETNETFLLRMRPYRTTDDRIDGYVLSFVDITTRKNAEEALRRNERMIAEQYAELENLYDTTPVGLSLMDRGLRWVRVNQMLADINGFPIEAHIGKRFEDLLPELAGELRAIYESIFETGEPSLGNPIETDFPNEPGVIRHFLADFYPIRIGDEVSAVGACVREVTEQKRLMEQIAANEQRMKTLFDASPVFIAITEGADHIYTYSNPAHDEIVGRPLIGRTVIEAFPELEGQGVIERLDRVYRTGEREVVAELEATFDRTGTGTARKGWFSQTIEPIRDATGTVSGVISFAYEISNQVHARLAIEAQNAHQSLLLGELQHRVKNTLATIRAISRMMVPGSEDAKSFHDRLSLRLAALARTHDLLTDADWTTVEFAQILKNESQPYDTDDRGRVTIEGDVLVLGSKQATSLGMAVHELMTNAIKHGALSSDEGRITVRTRLRGRRATICWVESGGPPVGPPDPEKTGFGTFVLDRILVSDLGGASNAEWHREGLRYEISFDIEEVA